MTTKLTSSPEARPQAGRTSILASTMGDGKWSIESPYRILYYPPMKTTLDIDDSLLANAKALAAQQRTSLTRLIEEGLQLRLRSSTAMPRARKPKIPVFKGRGGLVAGLDPTSNKAMLDAADDDA